MSFYSFYFGPQSCEALVNLNKGLDTKRATENRIIQEDGVESRGGEKRDTLLL